jgi:cell cycle checkpoint control protein RAD9A
MPVVHFTLSESGIAAFQHVLACVMRFSDDVSLEARKDKLVLTALNLSNSAYLSFTFLATRFFSEYSLEGTPQNRERFFCMLYVRSLLAVFRTRMGGDPARERDKDATIERCDVDIDDGIGRKSRFTAIIVCRNGMTAVHSLPFETKAPAHAKFDAKEATNYWALPARTLRQMMGHFGPRIELLDINTTSPTVVNFACFTEKQYIKAEDFLNKPLHTSIAVDRDEFDALRVEEQVHIIISVRDFKAILQHACTLGGRLSVRFSRPGRPLKISYHGDGHLCEFILMTVGERGSTHSNRGKRASSRPTLDAAPASEPARSVMTTKTSPAKVAPRVRFEMRPPPVPPAALRPESLFVPSGEAGPWEPVQPDDDTMETQDARLEWDTGYRPVFPPTAL